MKPAHALEAMLVRSLRAGVRAMPWRASLHFGAGLGDLARGLGIRRAVAEANLAMALPERSAPERADILARHYRHIGQAACEFLRLGELARAPEGEVFAAVHGAEHLETVRREGRGAILLSGHYGTIELGGAWIGQRYPVDIVVQPLSNPGVDAIHIGLLAEAGVGHIPLGAGARRIFSALRAGRFVAMLADQDARGDGVFVPFMGRLCSTPVGPAAIALRTGTPIVMGFVTRQMDGRHVLDVLPPLRPEADDGPDAVRALTARHTACLEAWVRRHPEMWFWLHRRWKTPPPAGATPERPAGPASAGLGMAAGA